MTQRRRDPVQPFRRMPCCFCPGGKPIGLQTYSMQLPAKNDVPAEVWFAAAIFESVVFSRFAYVSRRWLFIHPKTHLQVSLFRH